MGTTKLDKNQAIGSFEIISQLGSGYDGVVYLVQRNGVRFALKMPKQNSIEALERFNREAYAQARFNHSALAQVFEVGEQGEIPFMVMEYIDGLPLSTKILQDGPISSEAAIELGLAVAGALSEIHRYHLVHRDIKPQNIIMTQTGFKLIDLGMVGDRDVIELDRQESKVLGTLQYASPEQNGMVKRRVDQRSDLYSLGVTLYECVTGRLPFESSDISELLRDHATKTPVPPAMAKVGVDKVLSDIIQKLLKKDPDDRYQSARGLISDFENVDIIRSRSEEGLTSQIGSSDHVLTGTDAPMDGRQQELSELKSLLALTATSKGCLAIIEAESGMGKSRLAREVLEQAASERFYIFKAKCSERANFSPFSVFKECFDSLHSSLERNKSDETNILKRQLLKASTGCEVAIARISPLLAKTIEMQLPEIREELSQDQFVNQLYAFFDQLSHQGSGILFYIDDIQWADETTKSFLQVISEKVHSIKIQVLLTLRAENAEEFKRSFGGSEIYNSKNSHIIKLKPLNLDELSSLLRHLLGNRQIEKEVTDRLAGSSGGNPFLIQEIIYSLLENGNLRLSGDSWKFETKSSAELNFSNDVYRMILARSAQLPQKSLDLVHFASLIGGSFQSDFLSAVSGVETAEVYQALEFCVRLNFLECDTLSNTYRFFHDKIREAFATHLSDEKRKTLFSHFALVAEAWTGKISVYDRARYFRLSQWEKNPGQSFSSNLEAGLSMLHNYEYESAREILTFALDASRLLEVEQRKMYDLFVGLGLVSTHIGLHDAANGYYRQAFSHVSNKYEKAKLLFHEGQALTGEGKLGEAWEKIILSLELLGATVPVKKGKLISGVIVSLFFFLTKYVLTGSYGRLNIKEKFSQEIRERQLFALIYELGWYLSYLLNRPLELAKFTFDQYTSAFELGDSIEMGKAHTSVALVWAIVGNSKKMTFHINKANEIANKLSDRALRAFIQAQSGIATEFSGRTKESVQISLSGIPDVQRYLGSNLSAQFIVELGAQYFNRGLYREGHNWLIAKLPDIIKTNNYSMMTNCFGLLFSSGTAIGNFAELSNYYKKWLEAVAKVPSSVYGNMSVPGNRAVAAAEMEDVGDQFNKDVEDFYAYKAEDHHIKPVLCMIAHGRLAQLEKASADKKAFCMKKLKETVRHLSMRANIPLFKNHLFTVKAGILRHEGKFKKALVLISKAKELAVQAGSDNGHFLATREHARILRDIGQGEQALLEAQKALRMALGGGYANRVKQVTNEFGLSLDQPQVQARSVMYNESRTSMSLTEKRVLDALLQVSLASATSLDPAEQMHAILDEILKVFGADRGFVFVIDKKNGSLKYKAGRDSSLQNLTEPIGYSSTIVKKVSSERNPIVVTGSDELGELDSQSAIFHDLRSIMAVPLFLKEKMVGVIYVDSKLTKGLFTKEDIHTFSAIANHIAVSIELAKQVEIEAERREMVKDLEVSGAVQKMLLPSTKQIQAQLFELSSFYQPATKCGGDWWWIQQTEEDILIFVGDVTGHGAGPAMITASIAAAFRVYEREFSQIPFDEMIGKVNKDFLSYSGGEYLMTGMACKIDLRSGKGNWWSLGGPRIFLLKSGEKLGYIGGPGYPLGVEDFKMSSGEFVLQSGQRLMIMTDGIIEMATKDGSQLSDRKLSKYLDSLYQTSTIDIPSKLLNQITEWAGDTPQNDDYTMVIVEIKPPVAI